MADTAVTKSPSTFVLYRDRKLATWALYEPRVGNQPMPLWQAMGDGYGQKVTILASTKEQAMAKVEEYSKTHERHISLSESDVIFTYGVYGLLGGGFLTALGYLGGAPRLGRVGGVVAAAGLTAAVTGKIIEPKTVSKEDVIILDTPKIPGIPGLA